MIFEFSSPTRLVFGEKALGRLGQEAAQLGQRAAIVTGTRAMKASGHLEQARELLAAAGVDSVVFDRIPANPTVEIAQQGADFARTERCDLVIGLGGGSAMDSAKAIAIGATHDQPLRRFVEADAQGNKAQATAATLPVLCVTSTAGTSSELTPFAVLTVSDTHDKMAIRSPFIQPRVAVDDPELTYGVPPEITAATGVDVLCHALEAYVNVTAQPLGDLLAEEAIRLVGTYLPRVMADGQDGEARRQMLLANVYAGYGLANCGATVMHALEHPVSGHYPQVAHGAGLAAFILPWTRKVTPHAPGKFARLAHLLGHEVAHLSRAEAADLAAEALRGLLEQVGLKVRLRELGVLEENLEAMAADSCRYMALAVGKTPGALTAGEVLELLEDAF